MHFTHLTFQGMLQLLHKNIEFPRKKNILINGHLLPFWTVFPAKMHLMKIPEIS